jgi:hypothetical protein
LANVSTQELNDRWIQFMTDWAKNFHAKTHQWPREDIESELHLRKVEPPFNKAMDLLTKLRRKAREASDEHRRSPDRFARAAHDIHERILDFVATARRANANPIAA